MVFEIISILLREGIEMVLLLSIIILYLENTQRHKQLKFVYAGVIVAIIFSIAVGILLNALSTTFSPVAEGILFFITAAFVLTLIFWFHYGSKHLTSNFNHRMERAMARWQNIGIFLFTFLIIFREGAEIVLLLIALKTQAATNTYIEATIGIISVLLVGYFLIKKTVTMNIKKFYTLTTIMLVLIFIELLIHGLFEFMESHVINLGETIFSIFEFLVDGSGQYIFSGLLLVLLILLFVNMLPKKK